MIIRHYDSSTDLDQITKIYEKHFKVEFGEMPDFNKMFECAFVIEKHDKIILAGGVRSIAEVILLTDLEQSNFTRVKALKQALNISQYIGRRVGYDMLHAFIQDDKWRDHLITEGFLPTKGKSLFLEI